MVRVRFAPSPTGYLHVGNAWTALMNYLFARSNGGKFVLRIEDTDVERSERIYESSIMEDLGWLGISWDEGPYRQSDRLDIYKTYAELLLSQGSAYKCFCSKEELEEMRQASLKKGEPPRYLGRCRTLSLDVAEAMEKEGRPYVVRFRALQKPIAFRDEIHGRIDFPRDHVDDFIILKQELTPSYNFAVTVDDMVMGITHVIRGADHISNTPKQIMLFRALDKTPPLYAHHSLLTGPDRKPLSKRHGATRIMEFRQMGILREALINYLGVNGRNVRKELMDDKELVETFSLTSLSASDSVFDMEKLFWFNREYIRGMPTERLARELGLDADQSEKVAALRHNAQTLEGMRELLDIFEGAGISEDGLAYLLHVEGLGVLVPVVYSSLQDGKDRPLEELLQTMGNKTDLKKKELFMVLRVLFTGRASGPPLNEVLPLIPKEHIMKRIACLKERLSHQ